jgi:hypothetical protein
MTDSVDDGSHLSCGNATYDVSRCRVILPRWRMGARRIMIAGIAKN